MLDVVGHWIDGTLTAGVGDRAGGLRDPVTGAVVAEIAYAVPSDVDAAVAAARVAFRTWSSTPHASRANVLFRFRDLVRANKSEIAAAISAEHGKSRADALGEVARGLEVVDVACGVPGALDGALHDSALGHDAAQLRLSGREPHGVVALVGDARFPAMAPLWFFPLAIAAGNTVVLTPGDGAPSVAAIFAELWVDAGLPHGVFNVLHGDGQTVDTLVRHPGVAAVSVVGTARLARSVYERAAASGKHAQALGSAKSHLAVLADADLDLAAAAALSAGIGPTGDCAMTTSVVVVDDLVADDLVDGIRRRLRAARTSLGRDAPVGSLVMRAHRAAIDTYLDAGERSGAQLCVDGRKAVDTESEGFWLGPTVLDGVTPQMDVYADDVFGPVLLVVRATTGESALDLVQRNLFLDAASVFTADVDAIGTANNGSTPTA